MTSLSLGTQGLTHNPYFAVRALALANNIDTIVNDLSKKSELFAPIAGFCKRIDLGSFSIKAAILLSAPFAYNSVVNDLKTSLCDVLYGNEELTSQKIYSNVLKASAEVVESGGAFLAFVAENSACFSSYAPNLALAAEGAEIVSEGYNLYESWGALLESKEDFTPVGLPPEERQMLRDRVKVTIIKIAKSVLKFFSIIAVYFACSSLVFTALSASSLTLSMGADFYSSYNKEGVMKSEINTKVNESSVRGFTQIHKNTVSN